MQPIVNASVHCTLQPDTTPSNPLTFTLPLRSPRIMLFPVGSHRRRCHTRYPRRSKMDASPSSLPLWMLRSCGGREVTNARARCHRCYPCRSWYRTELIGSFSTQVVKMPLIAFFRADVSQRLARKPSKAACVIFLRSSLDDWPGCSHNQAEGGPRIDDLYPLVGR